MKKKRLTEIVLSRSSLQQPFRRRKPQTARLPRPKPQYVDTSWRVIADDFDDEIQIPQPLPPDAPPAEPTSKPGDGWIDTLLAILVIFLGGWAFLAMKFGEPNEKR